MVKKLIIVQAILLGFQSLTYFGCEIFQKNIHNVKLPVDDKIPFLPWSVLFYCCWFPLIAVYPLVVYARDPYYYSVYLLAMIMEIVTSVICYMLYPTSFERPVPPDTFWGKFMKLIYHGSYKGVNCAPSLHCSSCFLVIWISCVCPGMEMWIRIFTAAVAVLIVASTMTTKQHTVVDVVTAIPLCIFCKIIGEIFANQYFSAILGFVG